MTSPERLERHTLHTLLAAQTWLPPEYAQALSNHLPMGLHALQALGASDERLQQFFGRYALHFEAAPATASAVPAGPWTEQLGQIAAYPALRRHFAAALQAEGPDRVLRAALPLLWPGLAAAAFHGPIRVGHAVQAGQADELAAALAYWAARWQALPLPAVAAAARPWDEGIAHLQASRQRGQSRASLISLRMAEASASDDYQQLAAALAPAPDLAHRVAQWAAVLLPAYAGSRDFTLLHGITGLRAVQTLLPWLADAAPAVDAGVLDRALVAAWLSTRPAQRSMPDPLAWPALIAAALASPDEHVIKLVHACHEQAGRWGDLACRQAASAAVGATA